MKRFLLAALFALTLHGLFFGFVPIAFDKKPPKKPHVITISLASYAPVKPKPAAKPARKPPEKKQDTVIKPLPEKKTPEKKAPEKPPKTLSVKKDEVKPDKKVKPPQKKKKKPLKSVKKLQKKEVKPRKKVPRLRKKATKPKTKPKAPAKIVTASLVPEKKKVLETPPPSTQVSDPPKREMAVPVEETFEPFPDIPEDIEVEKETKIASIPPVKQVREARPAYKDNPRPQYPKRARRRGHEGTVVLEVLVDGNGRVKDLRIITSSGHSVLDKAAMKSVNGWLFEPGMVGDEKVEMWVRVPVRFELRGG